MRTNNARAYAVGVEGRLFANLVKDAESWISIGFMQTKGKNQGASYYDYTLDSLNKPLDSTLVQQGWIRRPTDVCLPWVCLFRIIFQQIKTLKFI